MNTQMRCGLYIRVSTEGQKEKGESLEIQLKRLKAKVDTKPDWIVTDTYKDAGVSAKNTTGRPEFQRMMSDVEADKLDVIICTKLDRMFRNTRDFLDTTEILEKKGIEFACLDGDIDTTTAMGRAFSRIRAVLADLERETTSERVRDHMIQRAKDGKYNGGITPYGYDGVARKARELIKSGKEKDKEKAERIASDMFTDRKKLYIDKREAKIVKEIYDLYLDKKSIHHVTEYLNSMKYKARYGGAFTTTTVGRILSNPFYCGFITYSKRSHADFSSDKLIKNPEYTKAKSITHSGIISESLFKNVQHILKEKATEAPNTRISEYLLSGLCKCSFCNSRMHATKIEKKNKRVFTYYRCSGRVQKGPTICSGNSMPSAELDEIIVKELRDLSVHTNRLKERFTEYPALFNRDVLSLKDRKKEVSSQLATLKVRKEKLFDLFESSAIDKENLTDRMQKLDFEETTLTKELADLESKLLGIDTDRYDLDATLGLCKNLGEVFDELNVQDRRELVKRLIGEIEIDKHDISFSIKIPPKLVSGCTQTRRGSLPQPA